MFSLFGVSQPTVCVTRVWAGVDNAWEQEKPEARKKPENAADSHTSGARCVSLPIFARRFFIDLLFFM